MTKLRSALLCAHAAALEGMAQADAMAQEADGCCQAHLAGIQAAYFQILIATAPGVSGPSPRGAGHRIQSVLVGGEVDLFAAPAQD